MTHESNQMLITYIIHVKDLVATPISKKHFGQEKYKTIKNIWAEEKLYTFSQARIQKFFKGGLEEEKCLLIHVSTRVHIKTT